MRQRRPAARSIVKVNAQSIAGYFGEGTPCFFVRGTILADSAIDGEYPTLSVLRDGNVLEVSWFDGSWAVVTIRTRAGNRAGDGLTAKMYFRDEDLRPLGIDCTRIVAERGLPFTFDAEALAAGLFDEREPVHAEELPESHGTVVYLREPEPLPAPERESAPEPVAMAEPEVVLVELELIAEPDLEPVAYESIELPIEEPEPPLAAAPAAPAETAPEIDFEPVIAAYIKADPAAPRPTVFDLKLFMERFRATTGLGKNPFVGIGASVAAVAVPVLAYLLLEFMKKKPNRPDNGPP